MNTHDIDIELPPLPPPFGIVDPMGSGEKIYTLKDMGDYARDYARAAIEADRKRRGEPVGYIMPTALKQLKAGGHAVVGGVSQGFDVPIYTAPQPAEPPQCTLANVHPDCAARKYVEPVKSYLTVKYDDKGDCLYVCCDSNEPAEAEENEQGVLLRRAFSDGRLVGVTIPNFMGRYAEPVKMPSDEELLDIFYEVDSSRNLELGDFALWKAFARALLARYSHLTATTHKSSNQNQLKG